MIPRALPSIAWIVFLSACNASERQAPFLELFDRDGVEVVRIMGDPADTLVITARALRIGSEDLVADGQEVFALITDITPMGQSVMVVDNRSARVALFDQSGAWISDIGRRGSGPGEHAAPIQVQILGDTLFVWDVVQRRMSKYVSGSFVESSLLASWSGVSSFAVTKDGYVHQLESGQLADPEPARGVLVRTGREGEVIDTLVGPYPIPEYGWINDSSGTGHMVNPPAFAIPPRWAFDDHRLAVLDPLRSTLELRDPRSGALKTLIELPYMAEPPTDGEREKFFRNLQQEFGLSDEVVARERGSTTFAEVRPKVAGLLLDDKGRLWVAEHDPAGRSRRYVGSTWHMYDLEDGSGLQVELPATFNLKAVRDGRAYGVSTLETGAQVVDVYRLETSAGLARDLTIE